MTAPQYLAPRSERVPGLARRCGDLRAPGGDQGLGPGHVGVDERGGRWAAGGGRRDTGRGRSPPAVAGPVPRNASSYRSHRTATSSSARTVTSLSAPAEGWIAGTIGR